MNILTIGNSFTDSLERYFPTAVESARCDLHFERANFGGCELGRHWSYMEAEERDVRCRIYQGGRKLRSILELRAWDVAVDTAAQRVTRAGVPDRAGRWKLLTVLIVASLVVLLCAAGAGYYFFLRPAGEEKALNDSVAGRADSASSVPEPSAPDLPPAPTDPGSSNPAATPAPPAKGGGSGLLEGAFNNPKNRDAGNAGGSGKQPNQTGGTSKPAGATAPANSNKPGSNGATGSAGGGQNAGAEAGKGEGTKKGKQIEDKDKEKNPESGSSSEEMKEKGGGSFA